MKSLTESPNNWKFQATLNIHIAPESTSGSRGGAGLLNGNGELKLHPALFTPQEVLDHFKIMPKTNDEDNLENTKKFSPSKKKKQQMLKGAIICSSVVWMSLMCGKDMSYEKCEILREAVHRVFEGIPHDHRHNLYTYVRTEVLYS